MNLLANVPTIDEVVGNIEIPPGTDVITTKSQAETGSDIGIIFFLSNLLSILTIVASIWVLFNLLFAGYKYLTSSGDADTHGKVRTQITNSVIGLILIAITYTIGGLIGYIFFGDAAFILNPELPQAPT